MTDKEMLEKVKMQGLKPYTEMKTPYEVSDAEIINITEKAIEIEIERGDKGSRTHYRRFIWLPKSQCGYRIYKNSWPTLCVERWLVSKNRLW